MCSDSPGGIYEILGRDLARPENRHLSVPLIRLITSGRLPKEALKDYAIHPWQVYEARRAAREVLWDLTALLEAVQSI